jgi:hypothetical protein
LSKRYGTEAEFSSGQVLADPEVNEPINVALLGLDNRARLLTDKEFPKLACVSPRFDTNTLQFWLKQVQDELGSIKLGSIKPEEAPAYLASRTAQIQVGEAQHFTRTVSKDFEDKLIDVYLRRQTRPHRTGDGHQQYVDTLLESSLEKLSVGKGAMRRRARPEDFLSAEALKIVPAKNVRFSRVLNGSKGLVLVDGLNLAVTSKAQVRSRAMEIGFGFYTIGSVKQQLQNLERRSVVRAAFLFHKPGLLDPELGYSVEQLTRDADVMVNPDSGENVKELSEILKASRVDLLSH